MLYKSFVCHYSPVLKAAFNSGFVEGKTQTYNLESTTEDAFVLFSEWIYAQRIEDDGDGSRGVTGASLADLWILAEQLLIPRLQNVAIDMTEHLAQTRNKLWLSHLQKVWDNTSTDSPLRRFFIHHCAWSLDKNMFIIHAEAFPREMLLSLAFYSRGIVETSAKCSRNMADFHVKEDDKV